MSRRSRPPNGSDEQDEPHDGERGRLSSREKKQQQRALEALAQRLVALRPHELDALDLDADLREAIDAMGPLSGIARNRQAKVVHGLLRDGDAEALERRLARGGRSSYHPSPSAVPGPAERWLEKLLAEGDAAVNELVDAHPAADRQQLRQLVRTATKTPPTAATRRARRSLEGVLTGLLADGAGPD